MTSRRNLALGVVALLLAAAGVAVAATLDDDPAAEAIRQNVAPTTSSPAPSSTTTTTEPATTTSTAAASTSTTATGRTTTTRRAATTTTAVPVVRTTVAALPCTPAQIEVAAGAEELIYDPGERIVVRILLRNRSPVPCTHMGTTTEVTFSNAAGESLYVSRGSGQLTTPRRLEPAATYAASGIWSHDDLPAGAYLATAVVNFAGSTYTVRATFQLT